MKKISQRDMAKMLGVNVSSVSRALKGQKGVGEELRQKIERMATENDYQADMRVARGRYGTTRLIGVVVPDIAFNHNPREIGAKAFRLLLDQINGDDRVRRMVVKTRLEIRESTRNI